MGRPATGWSTLATADFMRLPTPAAMMMTPSPGSVECDALEWVE